MGTYWGADGKTVDGRFEAILKNSGGLEPAMGPSADAVTPSLNGLWHNSMGYSFNENTFDRFRGNTQGTILASAARTATAFSPNQINYNGRGIIIYLNVTAAPVTPGAGGLQVIIQSIDPVTGNGLNMNVYPALVTTAGRYAYEVYPGSSGAAAGSASGSIVQRTAAVLPRNWLSVIAVSDAQSYTYSLAYQLIV